MLSRRHIWLIGGIYCLALAGLIGAAWLFVRAVPHAATTVTATPQPVPQDVPTLRALWPPPPVTPGAKVARAPSKTPTVLEPWPTLRVTKTTTQAKASSASPVPGGTAGLTGVATSLPGTPAAPLGPGTPTPTRALAGASGTATATQLASATPTTIATTGANPTASPTTPPGAATSGQITGRILIDGSPVGAGLLLRLQDQAYATVAETSTKAGGEYAFNNVADSAQGYSVTFAQDWNAAQYQADSIATWAWIGPVKIQNRAGIRLPDMDISLAGMRPATPEYDASFVLSSVTSGQPVDFTWSVYPSADVYWLDVHAGTDLQPAWQSPLLYGTDGSWNGQLTAGGTAQAGEYWWGIGARRALGSYTLTIYSYLTKFTLTAN
jgi:hypothetical protein